jgi:hypothetical protein
VESKKIVRVGLAAALVACVAVLLTLGTEAGDVARAEIVKRVRGGYSVEERLGEFGAAAAARLAPHFTAAGVDYPPAETAWLVFKAERVLEVFGRRSGGRWQQIRRYDVLGASGGPGPKLKEGDLQVPEGVYRIDSANPNSRFHVALRLDYPNAFDRRMAAREGRTNLGGDIMIHGKFASVGCLAMGDRAAEDLFTLAHATGIAQVTVVIAPVDLRSRSAPELGSAPRWVREHHAAIASVLASFGARGGG